jgi:hypothetical protein
MTYASAAPCSQELVPPPAPPFHSRGSITTASYPSPENGCEKSPALFEALYLLAGAIEGLVVLAVWAVR